MSSIKLTITRRTFHFKQPATTSRGSYTERTSWLVEASSDDYPGRLGIGECAPLPDLSCDAGPDYEARLRRFCDMVEQSGEVDTAAMADCPSMLFGLETALLHLRTGSLNLFDTPFGRGEEGIVTNGLVWMGSHDEMAQRIEQKLEQGFRCVKLKVGAIDFDAEMDLLRSIRSRFSARELQIRLDANCAFRPDEALYKLELLSQYAIHSIEQPIRTNRWGDMAQLCRESPLPIALDEELIGVSDTDTRRQLLNIIKPAYIVIKPSLHGGISGTMEWIGLARERGIGSWITSALESNVGLNAVAQLASHAYGPHIAMPQGLGTGLLYTDNVSSPLEMRGEQLWFNAAK